MNARFVARLFRDGDKCPKKRPIDDAQSGTPRLPLPGGMKVGFPTTLPDVHPGRFCAPRKERKYRHEPCEFNRWIRLVTVLSRWLRRRGRIAGGLIRMLWQSRQRYEDLVG